MKKFILSACLSVSLFSCTQDKIAYVDIKTLMSDYQEMKDIEALFTTKDTNFKKRLDSLSTAFQAEVQAFQKNAPKMSANAREKKQSELLNKQQMLQRQSQVEGQQIQQESQVSMDSVITKVKDYVKAYGVKNGYTFILGENEVGSVLYGKEDKNITTAVLKELNAAYKK